MRKKIILLVATILLLGFSCPLSAQINRATQFFKEFKYSKAIPLYKKEVDSKHESIRKLATIRLGDCYRLMNNVHEARSWYAKAVKFSGVDSINYFYLGMALRTLANYEEAEKAFSKYAELAPSDKRGKIYAEYCRDIKEWDNLPPSAELKNARELNSEYSEFGPAFYRDGIVFTSDRDIDMLEDRTYLWTSFGYLDMYSSEPSFYNDYWTDMTAPLKMSSTFNQPYHDGPASFNGDFNQVFITRTIQDAKAKQGKDKIKTNLLKIYYADLTQKKVEYKPFPYNSDFYSVGHPSVSKDGKRLIFSSDMPGGYGQGDLYISELVDGKWTKPENLGPEVNSFGNEVFPYWANDSTLFFSSDGHLGFGGLDVYETNWIGGKWSYPWNLKRPLNSPYDDFSVVFNSTITEGFISSNRPGGIGSDDIYVFRFYKTTPPRETPLEVPEKTVLAEQNPIISGYVKDKSTLKPMDNATVFLLNTSNNEVLVLKTNPDGYFESPIDKGILYVAKALMPDYFDDCLNFRIQPDEKELTLKTPHDLLLDKYQLNQVFKIENIYYDLDKWFIRDDAKPALDNLVRILKRYPINVELGSHTDSRASYEYNIELSQKRAEAAMRYITMNGISPERITAKGYGESMLSNRCADGIPCTEAEHQANRRTEFKITAVNVLSAYKNAFDPTLFKAGDKIPVQLLDVDFFSTCLENFTSEKDNKTERDTVFQNKKEVFEKVELVQLKNEESKYIDQSSAPVVNETTKEKIESELKTPKSEQIREEDLNIWYAIQIAASVKPIAMGTPLFKGVKQVLEKKIGVYYKYFSGEYLNYTEAVKEMKNLGERFKGAFVVAFKGDEPISLSEARKTGS